MNNTYSLVELKDHLDEIRAHAARHNKRPEEVIHLFLRPKTATAPPAPAETPNAGDVNFGRVVEATPEQEKRMAIALEMILQGARVHDDAFRYLYRRGYVDKDLGGQWGITKRGKALVERFKILTNEMGALLGDNLRVVKAQR